MKKNILLLFLLTLMFFCYNNKKVLADVCTTDDNECESKVKSNETDNIKLTCLYEVTYNGGTAKNGKKEYNGKKFYNYIYYDNTNSKFYSGSSGVEVNDLGELVTDSANDNEHYLQGGAASSLQEGKCPTSAYVDNSLTSTCYDNGGKECHNVSNGSINSGAFKGATSSKLIYDNVDGAILNDLYFDTCKKNERESEYPGICRYASTNGDFAILYYNNSAKKTLIEYKSINSSAIITFDSTSSDDTDEAHYYTNQITSVGNSCPQNIYYLYASVERPSGRLTHESFSTFRPNTLKIKGNEVDVESTKTFVLQPCESEPIKPGSPSVNCTLFNEELIGYINTGMNIIRIGVPILLIVLIIYDLATAVFAGDEKKVSNARSKIIKRIIIAVAIFFVPTIINFIFGTVVSGFSDYQNDYEICLNCLTDPNSCDTSGGGGIFN